MRTWYADPTERIRWGQSTVSLGLYPTEATLIDRYFAPGSRLLDIGCGGGREALALAERFDVVAVDFSRAFCRAARDHLRDRGFLAPVLCMDAGALALGDATFDHVVMVGQLIGQIHGRANRIRTLAEVRRVLKPGGAALISTNAIERGRRYRLYFALANRLRRWINPHRLEPDDAFVFHRGGRRMLFRPTGERPVFHWYRTPRFLQDAAEAGLECIEYLRRYEYETGDRALERSTSGETFYILKRSPSKDRSGGTV